MIKNSSPITMVTSRGKLKAFLIVRAREPCVGWKGRMGGWEDGRGEEGRKRVHINGLADWYSVRMAWW